MPEQDRLQGIENTNGIDRRRHRGLEAEVEAEDEIIIDLGGAWIFYKILFKIEF